MSKNRIEAFQDMQGVNVYCLDAVTRRPVLLPGVNVTRPYSVVMVCHTSGEFEPLAVMKEKELVRMLPRMDPFLAHIHRKRQ